MEQEREGGSLRRRVLALAETQMKGAAELLAFYIERFEPWPESGQEPLTEIHESWVRVQRGYEAISRRMGPSAAAVGDKDEPTPQEEQQ